MWMLPRPNLLKKCRRQVLKWKVLRHLLKAYQNWLLVMSCHVKMCLKHTCTCVK